MIDNIKDLKRNPLFALILATGWIFSAWLGVYPKIVENELSVTEIVIDAEKRAMAAQYELQRLKQFELDDIEDLMQQLVNTYDRPAWVKYLNYERQKFFFLATNYHYSEKYGTPFIPRDKTDLELYENVDLTPEQRATLLEYELNDRRAIKVGLGKCIVFEEYHYPVKREKTGKSQFKKCMLKSANHTFVMGHQM